MTLAPHNAGAAVTEIVSGQYVKVGEVASNTWTLKPHVTELPAASIAVNSTGVSPMGKRLPLTGPSVCVSAAEQLSEGVGDVKVTYAPHAFVAAATSISAGQLESVGKMLSRTVTVNAQFLNLPERSVALWRTIVVPMGKSEPEAGPITRTTASAPSQLSMAVGGV